MSGAQTQATTEATAEGAALPDGLALYRIEMRTKEASTIPEADDLAKGWEHDFITTRLGVRSGKQSDLSPSQNVALIDEQKRREDIAGRRLQEIDAYADFLRARGAIVSSYYCRVAAPPSAGEKTSPEPDLTSFIAAPISDEAAIRALHESPLLEIASIEQIRPEHLLTIAADRKRFWHLPAPQPADDPTTYAMRVRAIGDLEADAKLWQMVGGSVAHFEHMRQMRRRSFAPDEKVSFLVEGLIPRDVITLLVGARKRGKSGWLADLAVTVASGGGEFCGFTVPKGACQGIAVLIVGEDNEAVLRETIAAMDPDAEAAGLYPIVGDNRALADILKDFNSVPAVSLLVVDPARKYLAAGDEDGSGPWNEFFIQLEGFIARHKGCAVVVAHHPKGNGRLTSLEEVVEAARGSTVIRDRPRVHIGFLRRGDVKTIGIPVIDGAAQHNMPPTVPMFTGAVQLVRDPNTMRHKRLAPGEAAIAAPRSAPQERLSSDACAVAAAVRRITGEGGRVTRTGAASLFKKQVPELAGKSRREVEAAVDAAIDTGLIENGPSGLRVRRPSGADG